MHLDVFHRLSILSFQLSFQSGKEKKVVQICDCKETGDRGVAVGQEIGNDEGRVSRVQCL